MADSKESIYKQYEEAYRQYKKDPKQVLPEGFNFNIQDFNDWQSWRVDNAAKLDRERYMPYEDAYRQFKSGNSSAQLPEGFNFDIDDFNGWKDWRNDKLESLDQEYVIRGLDQDLVSRVAQLYKDSWGSKYNVLDAEDMLRYQNGEMPAYYSRKYRKNNDLDQYLLENGLPDIDSFSSLYYKAQQQRTKEQQQAQKDAQKQQKEQQAAYEKILSAYEKKAKGSVNGSLFHALSSGGDFTSGMGEEGYIALANDFISQLTTLLGNRADHYYAQYEKDGSEGKTLTRVSQQDIDNALEKLFRDKKYAPIMRNWYGRGTDGTKAREENPYALTYEDVIAPFNEAYGTYIGKQEAWEKKTDFDGRFQEVKDLEDKLAAAEEAGESTASIAADLKAAKDSLQADYKEITGQDFPFTEEIRVRNLPYDSPEFKDFVKNTEGEIEALNEELEEVRTRRDDLSFEGLVYTSPGELSAESQGQLDALNEREAELEGAIAQKQQQISIHRLDREKAEAVRALDGYDELRENRDFELFSKHDGVVDYMQYMEKPTGYVYTEPTGVPGSHRSVYDQLKGLPSMATKDEIDMFYYVKKSKGEEAAKAYAEDLAKVLKIRSIEADNEAYGEQASTFGGRLAVTLATPFNQYMAGFEGLWNVLGGTLGRSNLDMAYDAKFTRDMTGYRGAVSEHISNSNDTAFLGMDFTVGEAGAFLYQTANSMLDSAVRMPLGGVGLGFAGGSAASQIILESLERGDSSTQALILGVVGGAVEIFTEKIGLDELFKVKSNAGAKNIILNILKQAGAEGSEEMLSEIAGIAMDVIVRGDESELREQVQALMEREGISESAATARVIAGQVGLAGLGGALSGVGFGGIQATYQNINYKGVGKQAGFTEAQTEKLGRQGTLDAVYDIYKAQESQQEAFEKYVEAMEQGAALESRVRAEMAFKLATMNISEEVRGDILSVFDQYGKTPKSWSGVQSLESLGDLIDSVNDIFAQKSINDKKRARQMSKVMDRLSNQRSKTESLVQQARLSLEQGDSAAALELQARARGEMDAYKKNVAEEQENRQIEKEQQVLNDKRTQDRLNKQAQEAAEKNREDLDAHKPVTAGNTAISADTAEEAQLPYGSANEAGRAVATAEKGIQNVPSVTESRATSPLGVGEVMVEGDTYAQHEAKAETNLTNAERATGLTAQEKEAYDSYVINALQGPGINEKSVHRFKELDASIVALLKKRGVHFKRTPFHAVTDNDIRHIRNSHGIQKDGAYGVNVGDLLSIPFILHNADEVYFYPKGDKTGLLYVVHGVDETFYVEEIVNGDTARGKQMIKAPAGTEVQQYKGIYNNKEAFLTALNGSKTPQMYVQDVWQENASAEETITDSNGFVKTNNQNGNDLVLNGEKGAKIGNKNHGGEQGEQNGYRTQQAAPLRNLTEGGLQSRAEGGRSEAVTQRNQTENIQANSTKGGAYGAVEQGTEQAGESVRDTREEHTGGSVEGADAQNQRGGRYFDAGSLLQEAGGAKQTEGQEGIAQNWSSDNEREVSGAIDQYNSKTGRQLDPADFAVERTPGRFVQSIAKTVKRITGRDSHFLTYKGKDRSPGGFTNKATGNQYIVLTGDTTVDIFNLFHENAHNVSAIQEAVKALMQEHVISQGEYRQYLLSRADRTDVAVIGTESIAQLERVLGGHSYVQEEFACDLYGMYGIRECYNEYGSDEEAERVQRQVYRRNGIDPNHAESIRDAFEAAISENTESGLMDLTEDSQTEEGAGNRRKKWGYRYSMGKAAGGNPVAVLEEDILAGVPKKDWARTAKEALQQRFPKGVKVANSDIQINRNSKSEFVYSKDSQWLQRHDKSRYKDKMRSASIMDDILNASRDYVNEAPMHPRKDNLVDFARGKVLMQIGDNQYEAEVIVGLNSKGEMELHDIINMEDTRFELMQNKKSPSKTTGATLTASDRAGAFDGDTIPNARESVKPQNANSMENSKISKESVFKMSENAPIAEGMTDRDAQAYDDYVHNALKGAGNNDRASILLNSTSDRLISDLEEQGFDASGYRHRMRDNDIRHLIKRHGIAVEGAYGVTVGDILAIPYITENYTKVKVRYDGDRIAGIVYALDHVDTTYYVECLTSDRYLDGKQMIKAPLGTVPDAYADVFGKEISTSEYLDKAPSGVPEKYVQDVQQSRAYGNNIASDRGGVNRYSPNNSPNSPNDGNIVAETLGQRDGRSEANRFRKEEMRPIRTEGDGGVSKEEMRQRLRDQHTLDVGMRGMEVRSAKAVERQKAADALSSQREAHKQELNESKEAHRQEVKELKAEHRAEKKQQKAELTAKAAQEKADIHRYYKDKEAKRKARELAEKEARKANSPLGKAMAYYEQGLTPEDYMESCRSGGEKFDNRVNKQLIGMHLRNGDNVGGMLSDDLMKTIRSYTERGQKRRMLRINLTSPIRVFEEILPKVGKTTAETVANIRDGNYLRETYYGFGNRMAANNEIWVSEKTAALQKVIKEQASFGKAESILAQMLGEGLVTEKDFALTEGNKLLVAKANGGLFVFENGNLRYSFDGHSIIEVNKRIGKPATMTELQGKMRWEDTPNGGARVFDSQGKIVFEIKNGHVPNWVSAEAVSKALTDFYANSYEEICRTLVNNGYAPPGHIDRYFPHIGRQELGVDGFISALMKNDLPTENIGLTADFSPGQPWNANLQSRMGSNTEFDAIRGFNSYVRRAGDTIFMTPVINRLRQFESMLRKQGKEGHGDLTTKNAELAAWVHEYANQMANKKHQSDRGIEALFGREGYSISDGLTGLFSQSAVGGNVASALSNFISGLTGMAQIGSPACLSQSMKATVELMKLATNGEYDAFAHKIPFMVRRFSDNEGILIENVDKFKRAGNKGLYFLFMACDRLSVEAVARAKYTDCLNKGMSEQQAVTETDNMLIKNFADRGKGQAPAVFKVKWLKPFAQFQLEVLNQLSHFSDMDRAAMEENIEKIEKEFRQKGQQIDWDKISQKAIKSGGLKELKKKMLYLALLSLWGAITRAIMGRDQAFNPVGMVTDAVAAGKKEGATGVFKSLGEAAMDNLPFANLIGENGRVPIFSGVENVWNLCEGVYNSFFGGEGEGVQGKDVLNAATAFVPGGGQLKKIINGAMANSQGGKYKNDGRLQYPITEEDYFKTILFGPNAAKPQGQSYSESLTKAETTAYQQLTEEGFDQKNLFELLLDYSGGAAKADKALDLLATNKEQGNFSKPEINTIAYVLGIVPEGEDLKEYAQTAADKRLEDLKKKAQDESGKQKYQQTKDRYDDYWRTILGR